jgi:hypothetical protein
VTLVPELDGIGLALTGSVHWEIEVFNIAKAAKYLAQMSFRDIFC